MRRTVGRGVNLNEMSSMWNSFNPPIVMSDDNEFNESDFHYDSERKTFEEENDNEEEETDEEENFCNYEDYENNEQDDPNQKSSQS
jgi:hypothetical protein